MSYYIDYDHSDYSNMRWNNFDRHKTGLILKANKDCLKQLKNRPNIKLKVGDLFMCIRQSGDCFFDYVQLVKIEDKYQLGKEFSVYSTGEKYKWQPSTKEFHLLMAGQKTKLSLKYKEEPPMPGSSLRLKGAK